jgi:hypothetical protein
MFKKDIKLNYILYVLISYVNPLKQMTDFYGTRYQYYALGLFQRCNSHFPTRSNKNIADARNCVAKQTLKPCAFFYMDWDLIFHNEFTGVSENTFRVI